MILEANSTSQSPDKTPPGYNSYRRTFDFPEQVLGEGGYPVNVLKDNDMKKKKRLSQVSIMPLNHLNG